MPSIRMELSIPSELWDRIEKERGATPRATYVKALIQNALGAQGQNKPRPQKTAVAADAAKEEEAAPATPAPATPVQDEAAKRGAIWGGCEDHPTAKAYAGLGDGRDKGFCKGCGAPAVKRWADTREPIRSRVTA